MRFYLGGCCGLALTLVAGLALAQEQQQVLSAKNLAIEAVGPGMIQVKSERGETWIVRTTPGQSQVRVTGTAEPSFLHTGLFVSFEGEIDKKGAVQGDIKDMSIITQPASKTAAGLFPSGGGADAKPVRNPDAGKYEIRGKVLTYKDGVLTVMACKKISGKVDSSAAIKVDVSDLSLAQQNDIADVSARYTNETKPDNNAMRPGEAYAETIDVTISKPLTGAVKKVAKTPVSKKGAGPAAQPPAQSAFGSSDGANAFK
jgi:hypothetical protein